MPESIKDHSSHDIILLCERCRFAYEPSCLKLKHHYALKYGIALEGGPFIKHKQRYPIVSACNALLRTDYFIPQARKIQLQDRIKDYFQVETVTDSILMEGKSLCLLEKATDFKEHGEGCISKMSIHEMIEFVRVWRRHFLAHVCPKHLSPHWKSENPVI
jgi:hypothetical protein